MFIKPYTAIYGYRIFVVVVMGNIACVIINMEVITPYDTVR